MDGSNDLSCPVVGAERGAGRVTGRDLHSLGVVAGLLTRRWAVAIVDSQTPGGVKLNPPLLINAAMGGAGTSFLRGL